MMECSMLVFIFRSFFLIQDVSVNIICLYNRELHCFIKVCQAYSTRRRDEVFVRELTCCYSRPHDKEHPHCDSLQGGGQQATLLEDGVHHFILQGNQQKNEHCIKHGEPGSWEAERHLRGANKGAD